MLNGNDLDRARSALQFIPADLPRDQWLKVGMGLHAAGGGFDDFDQWSQQGDKYNAQACRATWRSFKSGKGIGVASLFAIAREYELNGKPQQRPIQAPKKAAEPPRKFATGTIAAEVWERCEAATNAHPYIVKKQAAGVPLDSLRVVPAGDSLTIGGERMAGSLVVPVMQADGTLSSLQFITATGKLNLPGHKVDGRFIVCELKPGGVAYLCEGIGTAWACWQATGDAAVVCFGAGNMGKVAKALRQQDPAARLVLVPDVGKESDAQKIALEVGARVAHMPEGEAQNFDASDLAQRDGGDVLTALLEAATEPPKPEPHYKLLSGADLAALPPVQWRVRDVLPEVGLAALYGFSASGKSFLAWDLAAAIAEGAAWFGKRVKAAPVVYAALEGEAGFKLRAQAWEANQGRTLPEALKLVIQPFILTEPQNVLDLAAVVPAGAVVFIDTLNRAAPTADENSSKDMGEILSAAKELQNRINGLVVLVHHTGKDATKGLRGHSSLLAALDAAVEVSRDGDRRDWRVAKSKDGQDGEIQPFRLKIKTLGIDEHGEPITSCVVMPDTAPREVRAKLAGGTNQRLILDALGPLFKAGATGKPGAPPVRPCIKLDAAVVMAASRLITVEEKRKPERAKKAIQDLIAKKLLGFNEGWLWLV